jgi:hypothetical protein
MQRQACQTIVSYLEMAVRDGMEWLVAARLDAMRLAGELPDVERLGEEFAPREILMPQICSRPSAEGQRIGPELPLEAACDQSGQVAERLLPAGLIDCLV